MDKVRIEITKEQAKVISQACELMARLHMGQVDEIIDLQAHKRLNVIGLHRMLKEVKQALFPELKAPNAYHSLTSKEIPDAARIAYDIHQVIRRHLAGERPKNSFPYIVYDDPLKTGNEPLIKIED